MVDRGRIVFVFAVAGTVAAGAAPLTQWLRAGTVDATALIPAACAALAVALAWLFIDYKMTRPAAALADAVHHLLRSPEQAEPLETSGDHALGHLPAAVHSLAEAARGRSFDLTRAVRKTEAQLREQRRWLEVALDDLPESVLVCDLDHRIVFHNAAAARVIGHGRRLSTGQSLAELVGHVTLVHALDGMQARWAALSHVPGASLGSTLFVTAVVGGRPLLQGRMSLVQSGRRDPTGYVVTLREITEEWNVLEPHDAVHRALTRDLRGPLGALCAAAQTLADFPDMAADERDRFIAAVNQESVDISKKIEALAAAYPEQTTTVWPLADIHFSELFHAVAAKLEQRLDITLTMVGIPLWLRADSHSLTEAVLAIFANLYAHTGRHEFDLECMLGDERIYVDINWLGEPVQDGRLSGWLDADVNTALGPQTARDILDRHDSAPWSLAKRDGIAALRIPLPLPRRPQFVAEEPLAPAFAAPAPAAAPDAVLLARAIPGGYGRRRLSRVPWVVMHADVTAAGGIVAMAAVLVENGRLLNVRSFEAEGAALAGQFLAFARRHVRVIHDCPAVPGLLGDDPSVPLIDTMVLSMLLDPGEDDHSLAAVAGRLGVAMADRHSEVGLAMTTGDVLLRQIERLRNSGIERFDDLVTTIELRLGGAGREPAALAPG
jgi:DNA polymerase-3 subunit epsilon